MMNADLMCLAREQAAICSVFSNPRRILILWSVSEREKSVTEIANEIDASLQSTSQHLHLMKAHNIVESRRDGQTIFYRPTENRMLLRCNISNPQRLSAPGR
jgi:DNA-binding transcriptional ArsR family regulator